MYLQLPRVVEFDDALDDGVSHIYIENPLAQDWARIAKVAEELGETIQCWIGATGQNPRKGYHSSKNEMLEEMADVFITALLAIQHFTKNEAGTVTVIQKRWQYRLDKMGQLMADEEPIHRDAEWERS